MWRRRMPEFEKYGETKAFIVKFAYKILKEDA